MGILLIAYATGEGFEDGEGATDPHRAVTPRAKIVLHLNHIALRASSCRHSPPPSIFIPVIHECSDVLGRLQRSLELGCRVGLQRHYRFISGQPL